MVITDDSGVIGLAGIMGGLSTAVGDETRDVFFEGAFLAAAHHGRTSAQLRNAHRRITPV